MPYTTQTWVDGSTVADAARFAHIETGILNAASVAGSVVVASNDAPASVKEAADQVCDGTADQVQIQAAIDLAAPLVSRNATSPAGAQQRGKVILTGGQFGISAPIQMRTAVHLQGQGWLTELKSVGNTGTGVIKLAAPTAHLTGVSDLWINGNASSGGTCNGIDYDMTASGSVSTYPDTNPDSLHWVDNLLISGMYTGTRTGIKMWASGTANNRGNMIRNCQIRDCTANGIWYTAASDSFVSGCHIGGSGSAGYRVEAGNTKITNCKSFYSDTYGFYVGSGRHVITSCESQDDLVGYYLGAANSVYSGLISDTSSTDGIVIAATGTVLSGFHTFVRAGGRYGTQSNGVRFTAAHTGTTLIGRVDNSNITTAINGTAGARSFVRVDNGSTLTSVG